MTESEYLYGVKVEEFKDLPYQKAIKFKLMCANTLYMMLRENEKTHEDRVRVHKVYNAKLHNEKLIREMEN